MSQEHFVHLIEDILQEGNEEGLEMLADLCDKVGFNLKQLQPLPHSPSRRHMEAHLEAARQAKIEILAECLSQTHKSPKRGSSLSLNFPVHQREPDIPPSIPLNKHELEALTLQKVQKRQQTHERVKENLKNLSIHHELSRKKILETHAKHPSRTPSWSTSVSPNPENPSRFLFKEGAKGDNRSSQRLKLFNYHKDTVNIAALMKGRRGTQSPQVRYKSRQLDDTMERLQKIQAKLDRSADIARQNIKEKIKKAVNRHKVSRISDEAYKFSKLQGIWKHQISSKQLKEDLIQKMSVNVQQKNFEKQQKAALNRSQLVQKANFQLESIEKNQLKRDKAVIRHLNYTQRLASMHQSKNSIKREQHRQNFKEKMTRFQRDKLNLLSKLEDKLSRSPSPVSQSALYRIHNQILLSHYIL